MRRKKDLTPASAHLHTHMHACTVHNHHANVNSLWETVGLAASVTDLAPLNELIICS